MFMGSFNIRVHLLAGTEIRHFKTGVLEYLYWYSYLTNLISSHIHVLTHTFCLQDWNTFLLRFNELDFCVSENETIKHGLNESTTPESTVVTSGQSRSSTQVPLLLDDSGPINISVPITLTLDPQRPFGGYSRNITHLYATVLGQQVGLSGTWSCYSVTRVSCFVPLLHLSSTRSLKYQQYFTRHRFITKRGPRLYQAERQKWHMNWMILLVQCTVLLRLVSSYFLLAVCVFLSDRRVPVNTSIYLCPPTFCQCSLVCSNTHREEVCLLCDHGAQSSAEKLTGTRELVIRVILT